MIVPLGRAAAAINAGSRRRPEMVFVLLDACRRDAMDLETTYMGMELRNPLVASASPLSRDVDSVRQMEDAGIAAVVMFSLFEEEIQDGDTGSDHFLRAGNPTHSGALEYFPEHDKLDVGPSSYIGQIARLKEAVDIPIIASLNGTAPGGWEEYARQCEAAGADALELNIYYIPTNPEESGDNVEDRYLDILAVVKETVDIPVAVKLSPFFSAMANMAAKLDQAGVDALVLFNRFYQPDIDLEKQEVNPQLMLSTPMDMRLPFRWTAILHDQIKADLAASSGIDSADDVIKMLSAGADVVMMTSALLARGIDHAHTVLWQMEGWLEEHGFKSLKEVRGRMSHRHCIDASAFERGNYIKALETYIREPRKHDQSS